MSIRLITRLGALCVVLALAACGSSQQASYNLDPQPRDTNDICAIFAQYPQWETAMTRTARKWGTPVEVKMAIMWRESRFRPDASPGTSSAYGFAQAVDGTWEWYKKSTGRRSARRDNFEDAADFVAWYMDRTRKTNGLSFNDPFRQYLAYHMGHTGYKRMSYRNKPQVINAAQEVQTMAATYRKQLRGCG